MFSGGIEVEQWLKKGYSKDENDLVQFSSRIVKNLFFTFFEALIEINFFRQAM